MQSISIEKRVQSDLGDQFVSKDQFKHLWLFPYM